MLVGGVDAPRGGQLDVGCGRSGAAIDAIRHNAEADIAAIAAVHLQVSDGTVVHVAAGAFRVVDLELEVIAGPIYGVRILAPAPTAQPTTVLGPKVLVVVP